MTLLPIQAPAGQTPTRRPKGVPVFPCTTQRFDADGALVEVQVVAQPTQPKRTGARKRV
jgi:hypothetical protein